MKKEWSNKWKSSTQPRKQRKYRCNAPLHVKHKFISANLSKELREKFGKRSLPIRKGDNIEIMRGSSKNIRGIVEKVDLNRCKVYIDTLKTKKVDGSEVSRPIQPSNLKIINLNLDDKGRQKVLNRAEIRETKKKVEPKGGKK